MKPAAKKPHLSVSSTPKQVRWHGRLAARAIWLTTCGIASTLRWRLNDDSGLFQQGDSQRVIFAIWHNRLSLSMILYWRFIRGGTKTDRRLAALTSASRDGGLLARVVELFGGHPVRGSSSRRGAQALRELVTAAEAGFDLAITPDGPRGPVYSVQEGIIALAQLTGYPIVPVTFWLSWKKSLNTWDRFQVPLPFSQCHVQFGKAIHVPRETSSEQRDAFRATLESELRRLTHD